MGRQEQHIKELVLSKVAKCGQCGGDYAIADINVLGHKDDLWFLMLICGQCHQAVGVAAVVKEQGTGAMAGEDDRQRRREINPARSFSPEPPAESETTAPQSGPITAGDVAAVHDFLTEFDGDFRRLFDNR